jgi:hypothetical protein
MCSMLADDFKDEMRRARESVGAAGEIAPKPPYPNGLSEDEFERLVFETTPVGVLELWISRLAGEIDKLRTKLTERNGDG